MKFLGLIKTTFSLVAFGLVTSAALTMAVAEEPPQIFRGGEHILIGASFDEDTVRSILPAGLEPVEGITGGINVYHSKGGSGFGPYTRAYVWADIAGYDSADGSKARYILWGVNGPDEALVSALGAPFELGAASRTADGANKLGSATKGGAEVMKVAIERSEEPCGAVSGTLNYIASSNEGLVNMTIPWAGDVCGAAPLSVEISEDDKLLAGLRPTALLWAAEVEDGAFAIPTPVALK